MFFLCKDILHEKSSKTQWCHLYSDPILKQQNEVLMGSVAAKKMWQLLCVNYLQIVIEGHQFVLYAILLMSMIKFPHPSIILLALFVHYDCNIAI